jgi:penicillin-binding protein 2
MRFKIVRILVFSLLFLIALDLFYAQIIKGSYYYSLSMRNRIRVVPLEGLRGRIFDRKGVVLADNQLSFDVAVVPQDIEDDDELFKYLGKVLNISPDELRKRFKRAFLTPFAPVVIADDVARDMAIEIEENKFRFPGLMIEESYSRVYPQGSIGAHVLGYVGKISRAKMDQLKDYGYTMQSVVGYSGIEEFYDDALRGEPGGRQIEINNRGQEVTLLGLKNPSVGRDITLTIDNRIQEIADELLQSRRGAVVVMDLASGEVLSMVSSPSYDPNDFADVNQRADIDQYFHDAKAPLLNRSVNSHFPPGSVFKIPVAITALETDRITRNSTFICPGYYALGEFRFGCSHVHNEQNLIQAIAHSCNVYFYHVGLLVGSDEVKRFARMLGLAAKTNIDLPFEAEGAIPSKSSRRKGQWFTGDTLNFSIGQGGVTATPIQLVKMMSIVANRGKVVHPHLIQAIGDHPVDKYSMVEGGISISQKTYDLIEEGLQEVVDDPNGTANALAISKLKTFGKTGTAQAGHGRDDHAWFVGYTKSSNKNIVYCVFLENGGSSYNAVVLARELLFRMQGLGII